MLHTANYWNIWEKFIQSLVLEGPVGPLSSGCAPGCDWITLTRASSWFMKLSMSSSELCVQAKGKWVETGWRSAIQSLSGIHCRGDKGGKGEGGNCHSSPWKNWPLRVVPAALDRANHTTVSAPCSTVRSLSPIIWWNWGIDVETAEKWPKLVRGSATDRSVQQICCWQQTSTSSPPEC